LDGDLVRIGELLESFPEEITLDAAVTSHGASYDSEGVTDGTDGELVGMLAHRTAVITLRVAASQQ